jgi:peptidoglycan/LPS O-acetylase OafA/YrhL
MIYTEPPQANHPPGDQSPYRPDIDGLRALAVLAVIFYHFNEKSLPNGYLGVDIFFVVSGYVITSSLYQLPGGTLGDFLLGFYARRIKRLVPAMALCAAISAILIRLFNPAPAVTIKTGLTALFGLSNLYLFRAARFYFADSSKLNIFTNTWSLGVEEQFYLIFPLIFWLLVRPGHRRSVMFPLAIGTMSLASLLLFIRLSDINQPAAFFMMPARFWELGAGCLLFTIHGRYATTELSGNIRRWLPLLLVGSVITILFLPFGQTKWLTLAIVLLTTMIIGTICPGTTLYRILTSRPATYTGLISYSLYLWHWTILTTSHWTIGIHWWSAPFQALLIFGLAAATHKYVEKPLRHRQWAATRGRTIAFGLLGSTAVAMLLLILLLPGADRLYLGTTGNGEGPADERQSGSTILAAPQYAGVANSIAAVRRQCNMTPHLLSGKNYQPKPTVDRDFIRNCVNSPAGAKKILLVGDSFALVSAEHIAAISRQLGYEFRLIYGFGCPYPMSQAEIRHNPDLGCTEIDERLLRDEVIGSLRKGDILVLRIYLPRYLPYENNNLPAAEAYDQSIDSLAANVNSRGAGLLVIGANPTLTTTQVQSLHLQWFNFQNGSANTLAEIGPTEKLETAFYHKVDDHLRDYFAGRNMTRFFSLKSYLCGRNNLCRITAGGQNLYSDDSHLTPFAHDLFFEDLLAATTGLAAEIGAGSSSPEK